MQISPDAARLKHRLKTQLSYKSGLRTHCQLNPEIDWFKAPLSLEDTIGLCYNTEIRLNNRSDIFHRMSKSVTAVITQLETTVKCASLCITWLLGVSLTIKTTSHVNVGIFISIVGKLYPHSLLFNKTIANI